LANFSELSRPEENQESGPALAVFCVAFFIVLEEFAAWSAESAPR
jgi:hypothetical protein